MQSFKFIYHFRNFLLTNFPSVSPVYYIYIERGLGTSLLFHLR